MLCMSSLSLTSLKKKTENKTNKKQQVKKT